VDWNPGGEGLENHRAGANLRLSEGQKGKHKYCTLEGLFWLGAHNLMMVSDLSKGDYSKRCRNLRLP